VVGDRADSFVSHTGADRAWAEWVAWQLTDAGYTVVLDVWDWTAGQNFITAMSDSLGRCDRVVALFSAAYFDRSRYTTEEWSVAALHVPGTGDHRLVPASRSSAGGCSRNRPPDGMDSQHRRDCGSELVADTGNRHGGAAWRPPFRPVVQPPAHGPLCLAFPLPHWNGDGPLPASFIYGGVLDGAVLVALAPVMLLACRGLPATFRPRPIRKARAYRIATTISRNW
jgi:TIR domain